MRLGRSSIARTLVSSIALVTVLAGADFAHSSPVELSEDELLNLQIVELRLRSRQVLMADMLAYQIGDRLYIPIEDLIYELGFQIEFDPETGNGSGWFLRQTQTFELWPDANEVVIAGDAQLLADGAIRKDGHMLYVDASELSRWFQLNIEWNARDQRLNMAPDYLLPAEEYSRRSRQTGAASRRTSRLNIDHLDRVDSDFSWLGSPHGIADISANWSNESDRSNLVSGNLALKGDFLKMSAEFFGTANSEGRKSARLTLGRRDPTGQLLSSVLGDYGATDIRLGDLTPVVSTLMPGAGSGLGIAVSRRDNRRSTDFDTTRIDGNAYPGWQAELYRDGALLGFVEIGNSGQYAFENVPLRFGLNRFRIELYGPSGERESVDRTIDISNAFVQQGKIAYDFRAMAVGKGVFRNPLSVTEQDLSDVQAADVAEEGFAAGDGMLLQGDITMGLTETISAGAGLNYRQIDQGEDQVTGTLSIARRAGGQIMTGRLAGQQDGGYAGLFGYSTELQNVSVTAQALHYSDKYSFSVEENDEESSRLQHQLEMRLDGRLEPSFLPQAASWSAGIRNSWSSDGAISTDVQARLSATFKGISISQGALWRQDDRQSGSSDQFSLSTSVSGNFKGWRYRGGLDTRLSPDAEFRNVRFDIARRYGDWYGRLGYSRDLSSDSSGWTGGISRDFNGVRFGLDVRHDPDESDTEALFTIGFDFDRSPGGNGMRFGRDARSDRGIAKVRVYEDVDLDGRYSEADRVIPNAGLIVEPRARVQAGDEALYVDDLSNQQLTGVAVDKDQLADPYLVPASKGASFIARPAGEVQVDLPVVMSGEVEIAIRDEEGAPVEGLIAELNSCRSDGEFSDRLRERSAFDGYVFFQFVRPGCYELSVPGFISQKLNVAPGEIVRPELKR